MHDVQLLAATENGVPQRVTTDALVSAAVVQRLAELIGLALDTSMVTASVYAWSGRPLASTIACGDSHERPQNALPSTVPANARAFVLLPMSVAEAVVLDPDDGALRHLALCVSSLAPRQWTGAEVGRLAIVARSVAADIRAEAQMGVLRREAESLRGTNLRDPVTGLANRDLLLDRLEQAILRASRRPEQTFALFSLGLDQFTKIEATLDYDAASEVLVSVARRLETAVRGVDTVARLGSDEFVLLLDGVRTNTDATTIAERVKDALLKPITTRSGDTVVVSPSIGIVPSFSSNELPARLVQMAGIARTRARERGTGFEFFDPEMREQAQRRLWRETELRRGIEADQFELHFQPIACLETGLVRKLEALIRWRNPERGLLTAGEFVPLAEETGAIIPIGWWVLTQACLQLVDWRRRFGDEIGLSVSANVAPVVFAQRDVVSRIDTILSVSGLPASCLNLEITEGALIAEPERARETLAALRELGVGIHLDDFGSGYSSLRYLLDLPLDGIKIDRVFVARVVEGGRHLTLVRTIRELARQIGASVVVEGVETWDQLQLARSLRCEYAQGYFLARPMPADEVDRLIAGGLRLDSVESYSPDPEVGS